MQAVLAFLAIIPKIIDLCERLGALVQEHRVEEWLEDLDKAISGVENAKTIDEKRTAARDLSRIIARGRLR